MRALRNRQYPRSMASASFASRNPLLPRVGVCSFAEPPDAPALLARPVWSRRRLPGVLRFAARPCRGTNGFDLRRFADLATVAVDPQGREHLLLANAAVSLRVDVVQGTLLSGPVMPRYRLAGITGLGSQLRTLRLFLRLCASGHLPGASTMDASRVRIAQALLVHDARMRGASLREVGVLLFGEDRVRREWPGEGDSMKSAVRRLVALAGRLAADPWSLLR